MTIQCEFGLGNGGFAQVAMGTVSRSNPLFCSCSDANPQAAARTNAMH